MTDELSPNETRLGILPMTIEQKTRDIAESAIGPGPDWTYAEVLESARLGIIEGLEMAAQVADALGTNIWQAQSFGFLKDELLDKETTTEIAAAIRALIEEQRPLGAEFEAVWDANTERLYES